MRSFVSGESRGGAVEDVEAALLDPVERRRVEAREGRDASGAAPVEVVEQRQAVLQVRPRPRAPGNAISACHAA